jgi:putative radical SAM enzyme (TIGR03279 family)
MYIKDDDYRLSFMHGNFITLTNITPEDYERIDQQRLSPLYISVHATDDNVRRRILAAPQAPPILADLKKLIDNGISVHTQIVVVPGVNDGRILDASLDDLAGLYPGVISIGVVPVGLTKYRERLPEVPLNTPEQARRLVKQIEQARERCLSRFDDPLVYAADELFVVSDRPIPPGDYYRDYPQLENGVGLVRQLCDRFEREFGRLPVSLPEPREVVLITGRSAEPLLRDLTVRVTRQVKNLMITVLTVDNEFWGSTVTVSGLLIGSDIVNGLKLAGMTGKDVLLPPDCLNVDGLFLDDHTPDTVGASSGCCVFTSSYSLIGSLLSMICP